MDKETLQLLIDNLLPVLALCAMVIILFTVIVGGFVFVWSKLKIKSASIKDGSIEFDVNGNVVPVTPILPQTVHSSCPKSKDILLIRANDKETYFTIFTKMNKIMRDQMKLVEDSILKITLLYQEHFIKQLEAWLSQPCVSIVDSLDYREYMSCLNKVEQSLRDVLRDKCKENGFSEMPETKFRVYNKGVVARLMKEITDIFNLHYKGSVIKLDKLTTEQSVLDAETRLTLSELLWNMREVSILLHEEIDSLEKENEKRFIDLF